MVGRLSLVELKLKWWRFETFQLENLIRIDSICISKAIIDRTIELHAPISHVRLCYFFKKIYWIIHGHLWQIPQICVGGEAEFQRILSNVDAESRWILEEVINLCEPSKGHFPVSGNQPASRIFFFFSRACSARTNNKIAKRHE